MKNEPTRGMKLYGQFLLSFRNAFGRELGPVSVSTQIPIQAIEAAEAGQQRLSTANWLKLVKFYKALIPDGLCRGCGCCDDSRCVGGCVWSETNLCSSCHAIALAFQNRIAVLLKQLGDRGQCSGCGKPVYFCRTKNGRLMPITETGISHFIDCPKSAEFRRERFKRQCQGE